MKYLLKNLLLKTFAGSFAAALLIFCLLLQSGCTNSDDDVTFGQENSDSAATSMPDGQQQPAAGQFRTNCGTVFNGELRLPIAAGNGEPGTVRVLASNQLAFSPENGSGEFLVKLQALDFIGNIAESRAQNFLNNLIAETDQQVLFFPADDDCSTTTFNGEQAVVGQIFTTNGNGLSESLIENDLARVDSSPACRGELIRACYDALLESSLNETVIGQNGESRFLWKPVSERDGNLVILITEIGAQVFVNDAPLVDFGPSNGRGTTARANRTGASYGTNVKVFAFDANDEPIQFVNGQFELRIPNGADRFVIQ